MVSRLLPDRIDAALKERLKDQKVVEIETAELLAERAIKWLKALGFLIGIPLVMAAVFFSFLGIKSWSDLQSVAQKTAELQQQLTEPRRQLANAVDQIKQLQSDLNNAKTSISNQISQVGQRQDSLEDQLKVIRGRLGFCPGGQASDALREKLEDGLSRFVVWLQGIGFDKLDEHIDVCIYSKDAPVPANFNMSSNQPNSFYANNTLYIHKAMAEDLAVALREYSHYTLTKAAVGRFVQDEVESALADYLPASFLKSPIIGTNLGPLFGVSTPYLRTLANNLTYSTAPSNDWYGRGQVWAAALWVCRDDEEKVDKVLKVSWERATSGGTSRKERTKRFAAALAEASPPTGQCLIDQLVKRELPH
jgi:hypothetical protein